MASTPCWLGIDLGTSAVKTVLVDGNGDALARADAALTLQSTQPLMAEQDPAAWWDAARRAVRTCLAEAPDARVQAVGLTGQKHAFLALDAQHRPLRPATLWADGRAVAACEHMRSVFPAAGRRMGFQPLPGLFLPKWLWFREEHPDLAERTAHVLYAKDWIGWQLTGERATDRTEASASHIFDFRRNTWSPTLAGFFELPVDVLPPVHPSTAVVGSVTSAAAEATGLPPGTPVVAGAGDNETSALCCGALGDGRVAVTLGTSGTVVGWSAQRGGAGGLVWNRHLTVQGYAATGTVLSAGRALRWIRSVAFPQGTSLADVVAAAEAASPDAAPLVFLPGLVGERSPVPDPQATGAFVGLRPTHGRGHLARAVMEGVALALGEIGVLLRGAGVEVRELRLTAGGATSVFWRGLIAAAAGIPVRLVAVEEGAASGAALLAMAASTGESVEDLAGRTVRPGPVESAPSAEVSRLQDLQTRMRAVRNALRGVHAR